MGAGGTGGGTNRFIVGSIMFIGGLYLLLQSIHVHFHSPFHHSIYNYQGVDITSGYVMIPLIFGIGMIFYNASNLLGWIIFGASLIILIFGVITSTQFVLRRMTAFELIVILTLLVGGLGLFLSALRNFSN